MDRELSKEFQEDIKQIALSHPEVHGVHELRTRQSGTMKFIQLHIEMDEEIPLIRAHAVADDVEDRIRKQFPDSDVIIHQDPFGHEDVPLETKQND